MPLVYANCKILVVTIQCQQAMDCQIKGWASMLAVMTMCLCVCVFADIVVFVCIIDISANTLMMYVIIASLC